MNKLIISVFLLITVIQIINGELNNVQGPFILWGLHGIQYIKAPALQKIYENSLLDLFDEAKAAVVARTETCRPIRSANKLETLINRDNVVILPQLTLPLTPDLFVNDTEFIILQGSDYEKDTQITEAFQKMENKYGKGNVLGILGTNCPEQNSNPESDSEDSRVKRDIPEDADLKEALAEVVYNAPDKILMYASDYPILRYGANENGTNEEGYKLRTYVSVSSDDRGQFSRLIVTFPVENGKVTLRFRFPNLTSGYWEIGSVELVDPKGSELLLSPKPMGAYLGAPIGFSFRCADSIVFVNGSVSLEIPEIQVQPQLNGKNYFGPAYDCVGFTTIPIWSGLIVSTLLIGGMFLAIIMILNIKTMDRFENSKGKMLSFTISE